MTQRFPIYWDFAACCGLAVTHLALLGMALTGLAFVFRNRRRPAHIDQMYWWAIFVPFPMIVGLTLTMRTSFREKIVPFVIAYVTLNWIIVATGMWQSHRRLRQSGEQSKIAIFLIAAVAGCLIAIPLFPATYTVSPWRLQANCQSQLKQIGIALDHYHMENHRTYPASATGSPRVSWRVQLLPYLNHEHLHSTYDPKLSWNTVPNTRVAQQTVPAYVCPANQYHRNSERYALTDYVMVTGRGSFGGNPVGTKRAAITDGESMTMAIVEASGLRIPWTEPRDFDCTTGQIGINLTGSGERDSPGMLSSYHPKLAHVLMVDGSVRKISQTISPTILKKLTTIAGGEVAKPDEL